MRAVVGESRGGDEASYNEAMRYLAESQRRLLADGHTKQCGSGVYSEAFEIALAKHSGREPRVRACTCGKSTTTGSAK